MTDVAVHEEQVPEYLRNYEGPTGAEGIDSDDLTIPRIHLAQALTPAVKDGKIKEGSLFLNITEEALAEPGEPLVIVPLMRSKEYILWRERNDNGGGVMARAVLDPETGRYKWDKPNSEHTTKYGKPPKSVTYKTSTYLDEDGLNEWGTSFPDDPDSPPAASVHYNYIVVLPEHDGMIAGMSLSRSQISRAKDFNAMLKLGKAPIFARKFVVVTEDDKREVGNFKNYRFRPAGFVDEQTMLENKKLVDSFARVNVTFDESSDTDNGEDL